MVGRATARTSAIGDMKMPGGKISLVDRPSRPARGSRGAIPHARTLTAFTLLELMVVTVVIGIATALILPQMRGTFEDMLLRSTGRTLVSAFALASSQAITINRPHRVLLDSAQGRYWIERAAHNREEGTGFVRVDGIPRAKGELDKRIRIQVGRTHEDPAEAPAEELFGRAEANPRLTTAQAITFYADGTAEPKEVLLRDRDGFGLALRINPTTARVRIVTVARQ